jgi:hypothetical protein
VSVGRPLWEAEQARFGASHAEAGAYLLGLWGLPESVVEAVAFHHRPGFGPAGDGGFGPLTAVHAADCLEHEADPARAIGPLASIAPGYLEALGLADRLPAWREACRGACQRWVPP